ncbi:hypothetical protein ACFQH5_15715 [Halomonas salifodinae]|uniref:Bbp19-like phage domain-containing protein n=1 Tax=Halomonas salifodinae TaxID=438745 RepID=A0ABW2F1V8_9GAMM
MTQEELQQQEAERRADDMTELLALPAGRRVLFELFARTGAFDDSFTGNSGSFYKDGRKSVGLELFHEVMALDPERFTQMWKEAEEAERVAAAKLNDED